MTATPKHTVEFATNGEVSLAYERTGPENAETIVFVERLGYSRWMWSWQRDALADGYDVILPDNRGTGDSDEPKGPYTIPEIAGDLDAVLADANVDSAHVVGASMGGMIALQYALEYDRVESLGLVCTSFGGEEAVEEFDVSDRCDEIDVPALVLHGTDDRVVPFENGELLADRLPRADLIPVDGGPHLSFIEQAALVSDHLTEFLDDV